MSRIRTAPLVALAACLVIAVIAFAGCGSDDGEGIPPQTSNQLNGLLNEINAALAADDCDAAQPLALEFSNALNDLPFATIGRNKLVEAGGNLNGLISDRCADAETPATASSSPPATTTPTTSTPTSTTSSTSTTTSTETTTTDTNPGGSGGGGQPGGGIGAN